MTERLWPRWMTTAVAAEYTCYEVATLENWRYAKDPKGPAWEKTPTGGIRYDRDILDAWMISAREAS